MYWSMRLLRLDDELRHLGDRAGAVQPRGAGAHVHAAHVGVAVRRLHPADRHQVAAVRLERLHDRLELEVAAGLVRMPQLRIDAVRDVDRAEPERPLRGLRRERGNHRVEERHRDHRCPRRRAGTSGGAGASS